MGQTISFIIPVVYNKYQIKPNKQHAVYFGYDISAEKCISTDYIKVPFHYLFFIGDRKVYSEQVLLPHMCQGIRFFIRYIYQLVTFNKITIFGIVGNVIAKAVSNPECRYLYRLESQCLYIRDRDSIVLDGLLSGQYFP